MVSHAGASKLPILQQCPGLAERPFIELVARPSAVERCSRLGDRVWVKRDDLVSPVYGGNKVRRWEWLLAAALERGQKRVLSVGGQGSTQLTSLMAHAQRVGLSVTGVMFEQPDSAFVAEAQRLDAAFGGRMIHAGGYARTAWCTAKELWQASPGEVLLVPPGASTPLANVAYVDALLELAAQVAAGELPQPDAIVVACGSGGTAIGLSLGVAMLGWSTTVVAVRITDFVVSNPLTLRVVSAATERLLRKSGLERLRHRPRIVMEHRFVGPGYGFATPEAERGALVFEELFGAPGEVTYSGKALAALDAYVAQHPKQNVVFWNTLSSTGRDPATASNSR